MRTRRRNGLAGRPVYTAAVPVDTALRAWAGDTMLAWQERLWDPLRRRHVCPLLESLQSDPALAGRPVARDLDLIFRRVVGRRLTRRIVGPYHRWRQSLTDFLERGAANARRLAPYVEPAQTILEFGGGVGRLGRWIAPGQRRFVSVDIEPVLKVYGRVLSPGIEFFDTSELPDDPVFDGAYSIAVFFHLTPAEQQRAIEYVYRRLKPGGWFLVDLKIGPRTTGQIARLDSTAFTALEDFRRAYEPFFTARQVPLFYSGFLLRKRPADSEPSRFDPSHVV